jgi:hypothetical protein
MRSTYQAQDRIATSLSSLLNNVQLVRNGRRSANPLSRFPRRQRARLIEYGF